MFYSKPPRVVGDLFGVLDNHSPFVFSSSHFEKQNEKKEEKKNLGSWSDEPSVWGQGTNPMSASRCCCPKKVESEVEMSWSATALFD